MKRSNRAPGVPSRRTPPHPSHTPTRHISTTTTHSGRAGGALTEVFAARRLQQARRLLDGHCALQPLLLLVVNLLGPLLKLLCIRGPRVEVGGISGPPSLCAHISAAGAGTGRGGSGARPACAAHARARCRCSSAELGPKRSGAAASPWPGACTRQAAPLVCPTEARRRAHRRCTWRLRWRRTRAGAWTACARRCAPPTRRRGSSAQTLGA